MTREPEKETSTKSSEFLKEEQDREYHVVLPPQNASAPG